MCIAEQKNAKTDKEKKPRAMILISLGTRGEESDVTGNEKA